MALLTSLFTPVLLPNTNAYSNVLNRTFTPILIHTAKTRTGTRKGPKLVSLAASSSEDSQTSTKLVTFLGKGGSGKTTSAIFAAQHFAMAGFSTCLVIHTQDPTAEFLLNCKIGTSPILCNKNLSAVRFETTQMLLGPLKQLKQADARLNMSQGVLEGIVGEELGVLPGMDPIFSALALERLIGFFGNLAQRNHNEEKFDIIVYDGMSSEEMLRMISAAGRARLYLKYIRNMADKTDLGRLAGPSLLRLVDEAMIISSSKSPFNGKMSAEIWDSLDKMLERGSSAFSEPQKFGCFLVFDPDNPASINSAVRYWGCTIQAGAQICGAFAIASPNLGTESEEELKKIFSPLPFAFIPHLSLSPPLDWVSIMQNAVGENARNILSTSASGTSSLMSSVTFDTARKSVNLFMPGFDKSEIKLYQYRGGSELLVEAGDQRRVIHLPSKIQGKVVGAKFIDRNLVLTMR